MSSEAAKKPTPLNPFVNREKETESIPPKLKAIQKGICKKSAIRAKRKTACFLDR